MHCNDCASLVRNSNLYHINHSFAILILNFSSRFSTKDPIKGRLTTINHGSVARPYGLSSTGNYTISSVVNSRHDVNLSNQCSSWNIFGIPRVETSPTRTKLDKARTLPFWAMYMYITLNHLHSAKQSKIFFKTLWELLKVFMSKCDAKF